MCLVTQHHLHQTEGMQFVEPYRPFCEPEWFCKARPNYSSQHAKRHGAVHKTSTKLETRAWYLLLTSDYVNNWDYQAPHSNTDIQGLMPQCPPTKENLWSAPDVGQQRQPISAQHNLFTTIDYLPPSSKETCSSAPFDSHLMGEGRNRATQGRN
jgi:hypothetical protein